MTTKLNGTLKREIAIGAVPYVLTISPQGMALVLKGKRKGFEVGWDALVSGDAALATALNASLTAWLTPGSAARRPSAASAKKSKQ